MPQRKVPLLYSYKSRASTTEWLQSKILMKMFLILPKMVNRIKILIIVKFKSGILVLLLAKLRDGTLITHLTTWTFSQSSITWETSTCLANTFEAIVRFSVCVFYLVFCVFKKTFYRLYCFPYFCNPCLSAGKQKPLCNQKPVFKFS